LAGNQFLGVTGLYDDSYKAPLVVAAPAKSGSSILDSIKQTFFGDSEIIAAAASETAAYNIKFIMLGDILDIALESLNNIGGLERDLPRIIVGNIPMEIPIRLLESTGRYSKTEMKEINPSLADIPISYNLFQEFMTKHVVTAKKDRYPVIQFIKDIITELIHPALAPSVLGQSDAINAPIRFSTSHFTFETRNGKEAFSGRDAETRLYPPLITKNSIQDLSKTLSGKVAGTQKIDSQTARTPPQDTSAKYLNYMFIVCTSKFPRYIDGDEDKDIAQGTLHMRMGTDSGILKKFNFSKMDAKYQREVIARREGNGKGTSLKQYYNATVDLFGNNIFRPGDFIYIHPNYMYRIKPTYHSGDASDHGSGKQAAVQTIDLEDSLGVGGYYLVINVKTDINDMAYKTELKCIFQAHIEHSNSGTKTIKAMNEKCKRKSKG